MFEIDHAARMTISTMMVVRVAATALFKSQNQT
jgi:hypothetical protein